MMSYTTVRCVIWSLPFAYLTLKANDCWPHWIWPSITLTGVLGLIIWRVIADSKEEDRERERVRKLEEFYKKHKDVE